MIVHVLLIFIFWSSFAVVGRALTLILLYRQSKFIKFALNDWSWRYFTYFVLGFSVFSVFIVLSFLARARIVPMVLLWDILVAISLIINFRLRSHFVNPKRSLALTLIVLCFIFELTIGTKIGGNFTLTDDVWTHIARASEIQREGITSKDPFFRDSSESRYSVNSVQASLAVGAENTNLGLLTFWKYSLPFFGLLKLLSLLVLIKFFTGHKEKITALSFVATTSFVVPSLYYAEYPRVVAVVWVTWLFCMLCQALQPGNFTKIDLVPLCIVSLLVSTTHSAYAIGFIGLSYLFLIMRAILNRTFRIPIRDIGRVSLVNSFMIWTPLWSALQPNNWPTSVQNYGDGTVYKRIEFLGHFTILDPRLYLRGALVTAIIISMIYIWRNYRLGDKWALALSSLLFFPILAYNPIITTIIRHIKPLWIILVLYFREMDILMYIYIPLSIGIVCVLIIRHFFYASNQNKKLEKFGLVVAAILIVVTYHGNYKALSHQEQLNDLGYNYAQSLKSFAPYIRGSDPLILADAKSSYIIPAVLSANVLYIDPAHASPEINFNNRLSCLSDALSSNEKVSQAAIKQLRPNYIIISKDDSTFFGSNHMYLEQIASNDKFLLLRPVSYNKYIEAAPECSGIN